MSFSFVLMTVLLGSSMVIAFVLQPSREESAASANSPVSNHRCQAESMQSIKKILLRALNMQTEPRLPRNGVENPRAQWKTTLSNISLRSGDSADPAVSVNHGSPDGGNSTGLKCCTMSSEIFLKDLGWDSWVILPLSVTIVHCALCSPEGNVVQCPSFPANVPDAQDQALCCQPTSQENVQVLYVDGRGTVVLSSMQLPSSCGCGSDLLGQPCVN